MNRVRRGLRGFTSALLVCTAFLMMFVGQATAGNLSCSLGALSPYSVVYNTSASTPNRGSGSITINCSKPTGGNTDTVYYELGIDLGLQASGTQRQLSNGSYRLAYGVYSDAAYSQTWLDTSSRYKGSITSSSSTSVTVPFYLSMAALQAVGSGSYADLLTVKFYQGATAVAASTDPSPTSQILNVSASVAAQCVLSSPPGNLNFAYTSFQTSAASASTGFAVTCNLGTSYTMSLDASSGTLLGLNYQLSISPSGTITGSGNPQAAQVVGTVAAGQSGTCASSSCSASAARVLTVSY